MIRNAVEKALEWIAFIILLPWIIQLRNRIWPTKDSVLDLTSLGIRMAAISKARRDFEKLGKEEQKWPA